MVGGRDHLKSRLRRCRTPWERRQEYYIHFRNMVSQGNDHVAFWRELVQNIFLGFLVMRGLEFSISTSLLALPVGMVYVVIVIWLGRRLLNNGFVKRQTSHNNGYNPELMRILRK